MEDARIGFRLRILARSTISVAYVEIELGHEVAGLFLPEVAGLLLPSFAEIREPVRREQLLQLAVREQARV